ncbi:hypothetical protein SAMN05216327_101277 [Dyadobacter sp. SG02]|uniref:serine protease n=1 Tax=Dyadobacter sp. SG02 TaxID=1855291 RepID=UPI0008C0BB99|nr:serine protease [Dyadobacter sp. SG02]SEI40382.1 hypothetical protein SAMN05216327_101277 [Dyadobacter sp. SG02]
MSNPFPSITPYRWFCYIIGTLCSLLLIYLLLHCWLPEGLSKATLSQDDLSVIRTLLYQKDSLISEKTNQNPEKKPNPANKDTAATPAASAAVPAGSTTAPAGSTATPTESTSAKSTQALPDGQRPVTQRQRDQVLIYMTSSYPIDTIERNAIEEWIQMFDSPADLLAALKDYVFPVRSYFWLYDGGLYAEVIFWTWFGLIASLLYSVSESLRKGLEAFDKNELWVHIAKFFYAPLCSLVIFVGISLAISDKPVIDQIDYSPNQILVAFMMGFFSGRLVQFLQGIKNLIFPSDTTEKPSGAASGSSTSLAEATGDDILQAIEQEGDRWRMNYPNVVGIALQTKQKSGSPTGQLSALFEVKTKTPGLVVGKIPPFLPFETSDGRTVGIPTDVVQVGETRFAYNPGPSIHHAVPTAPGGSIRRADQTTWGTLGLGLKDSQFSYVLSCYHVLCADLLARNQTQFRNTPGLPTVAPGEGIAPTTIGEVVEGQFSPSQDFALVRLNNATDVSGLPFGTTTGFHDILDAPGNSLVGRTVFMVGARSNAQKAKVLAPYQEGEYFVPGLPAQTMKGLIKTERLADEGDSGAAVYLEENGKKRVIGLLIGFNCEASYVLPIGAFCTEFNLRTS